MTQRTTFEVPTTDSMTALLSGQYFRHVLREELLPKAQEREDPLSLFLFDIDNFLEVNERFGHNAGDRVLQLVASTLQSSLPESMVLMRHGGDEFGGALLDTRLDDAFTLLEELRRRIAALSFEEWPELRITCSIGLATYPTHATNDVELMREADQALYLAKATGRNKVALPLRDSRMVTKTSYYTATQLERLKQLAETVKRNEASILREALDDILKKYNDQREALQ